ncbi:helix-turn-helix domain-containing protein [Sulfuriferula sp. GW1]|uniref:helix-turn-helix domain-containing protein n=1 Tax=Sulfuriferula sp. GW1 TaxID=3345111 RepID=UPI0039AF38CC
MAIKNSSILTREDYNQAQVTLGLTYADLAKEVGLPRQYLSEFRAGTRNLVPEHQRKLRNYFEDNGIVFEDSDLQKQGEAPTPATPPASRQAPEAPHPSLGAQIVTEYFFPIDNRLPGTVIESSMDFIETTDDKLIALGALKLGRNEGVFGIGEDEGFDEKTAEALQDAIMNMAAGYLVFMLTRGGWSSFTREQTDGNPVTLRDQLYQSFRPALEAAGLIEIAPDSLPGEFETNTEGEDA